MTSEKRVPRWVPVYNVVARRLLSIGVRMGPDALLTVRGRRRACREALPSRSAKRRTAGPDQPVRRDRLGAQPSVCRPCHADPRRAKRRGHGVGTVAGGSGRLHSRCARPPHAKRSPIGGLFVRYVDKIDIEQPEEAARSMPVLEIYRAYHSHGGTLV